MSRLVLVGDSLAFGLRNPLRDKARNCAIALDSHVKGGSSVFHWAPLAPSIAAQSPDAGAWVVSLGGASFQGPLVSQWEREFSRLVQAIPAGAWLLWVEPPAFTATAYQNDRGIRKLIAEGVESRPRSRLILTHDLAISDDGVHPTGPEVSRLAERIWAELRALA